MPVVVLAGRANAGKSTLFNRIARHARAIVSPVAGTTRDLNRALAHHDDREFVLIDSGGLELSWEEPLAERVLAEALRAVAAADLVVFVVDGRAGLNPADAEALALVREVGRPMLLAVNKIDRAASEHLAAEFHALGVKEVFPVSAAHGHGVEALLDAIVVDIAKTAVAPPSEADLRVGLVGRPNVGKSSLLNRLAGFERSIVHDLPGTTRDPVDVRIKYDGRELILVDTAGVRRRTRIEAELEQHSVRRALETIRRSEVLMLVIDATEGITDQDARLARLIANENRALVVVCNKWDMAAAEGRRVAAFVRDARARFPFLEYAPMVFTSALKGDGVSGLLPAVFKVGASFRASFQTARLNRILAAATAAMDPPVVAGRRLNLLYVTQVSTSPPTLAFIANLERDIPVHYLRFLEGRFRAELGLAGSPLRIILRKRARGRGDAPDEPSAR